MWTSRTIKEVKLKYLKLSLSCHIRFVWCCCSSLCWLVGPLLGIWVWALSPFVIVLFGSAWSCPECSGAENPETACRANQEPPGTDLLSCSACTRIQRCIACALKWLLGSLGANGQSKRVYSLSHEELSSITSVYIADMQWRMVCCAELDWYISLHRMMLVFSHNWMNKICHLISYCLNKLQP